MRVKKSIPLIILVVLLTSCTLPSATATTDSLPVDNFEDPTSTVVQEPTIEIVFTNTPLPAPPSDTPTPFIEPTPTNSPTPTETFLPPPTPPPAVQTTVLQVDVSNLSDFSFEVRPNTDLTLIDIGNDGKSNRCNITKTGFSQSITIPISSESLKFQLPPGEYRLVCEIPNKSAKIVSQ